MKVYAEHGALRDELRDLERRGLVELMSFPYEARSRRFKDKAIPSRATFADLSHITFGEAKWTFAEFVESDCLSQILKIVGDANRLDALHIDSAYKAGCKAFLSRDRKHIISKAAELERLLGLRIFHPDDDWEAFLAFVSPQKS